MKVQGIVPPFHLQHPAGPCSPQPCQGAQSAPGQGFPQAALGFFCLLSFVKLAFFSLAEYLAVSIYLFPSWIFFF